MKLKKRTRDLTAIFILLVLCTLAAEITLRLLGYQPYSETDYKVEGNPGLPVGPHPSLGFGLLPGSFDVVINDSLFWTTTQNEDSLRQTRTGYIRLAYPQIGVFGCSYTYGWGVHDDESYPWRLQSALDSVTVINYAVPGHGSIQALIRLRQLAKQNRFPALVILNHASFHNSRDRLTGLQQKRWQSAFSGPKGTSAEVLKSANFPFVQNNLDDPLQIEYLPAVHFPKIGWTGRNLALAELIDEATLGVRDRSGNKQEVGRRIVKEIQTLCVQNQSRLLLTAMQGDSETIQLLEYAAEQGADTLRFSVDLRKNQYNNLPWDGHPNAEAHAEYAFRVLQWLNNNAVLVHAAKEN